MVKDPVCGMSVDEKKNPLKFEYKNQTYHFCGGTCHTKFKSEPAKYTGKPEK